jgi:hypothetical protein
MSAVSTAMAHEKGGNQKLKRGIARRCTARRALLTREGGKRGEKGKGGRRTGVEEGGGGGRSMREGKEEGNGRVCAPDAAR